MSRHFSVMQDLRYALRLMRKSPGFAAVAVLTLALGIGATTAVFSIVDGVLLRPLPYRDPARLVAIWDHSRHEGNLAKIFASYPDLEEFRRHSRSFDSIAAATWAGRHPTLTGRGPARNVLDIPATANFFDTLGVKAVLGRTFLPEDESRGCSVVLAGPFWKGVLHADPHIVGQTLALDRDACRVLGVMPDAFSFYPRPTEMWKLTQPEKIPIGIFARLRPGVTREQAQSELIALHTALHAGDNERTFDPYVYDLQSEFTFLAGRNLRATLWILLGAVLLVLLIACVNVANLLLGRSLVRAREFAIRAALGGGRARLFRQLIAEGLLLGIAGGGAGIFVALAALDYFRVVNPVELPIGARVELSLPVLALALVVSLATAVLFALAPAWRASQAALNLRGVVAGRQRLARLLVVAEMALSVVLLAGAGLLMQSVLRMASAPLGFNPEGIYATDFVRKPDANFNRELEMRLAAIPGTAAVALASSLPPYGGGNEIIEISGRPNPGPDALHDVSSKSVTPSYFQTMAVQLERGRAFDPHDTKDAEQVGMVNDALAHEYFPNADPIGQRVKIENEPWTLVVGVVADEKQTVVMQEMNWVDRPILYRPLDQRPSQRISVVARTATPNAIRTEIAALDPNLAVAEPESMRHKLSIFLAYPRFRAVLLAAFAAIALLLAAVGLHGVLSQLVAQRTQEIGVRIAVGAQPQDVLHLIAKQAGIPVLAGLTTGIAAALAAGRTLAALLYGVSPSDPLTLLAVAALLLSVAALATLRPAQKAAQTDPIRALRSE